MVSNDGYFEMFIGICLGTYAALQIYINDSRKRNFESRDPYYLIKCAKENFGLFGDKKIAIGFMNKAIKFDPHEAKFYREIASCYQTYLNNPELVIKYNDMADILDPPTEELYIEDGKLRRKNKQKGVDKKIRDF